ncbi:MAG: fasciclin domain-containing protein [Gemmataceae bacterium]|nr:fasciclin domain-containing protein [Gemmataceae bacterium]
MKAKLLAGAALALLVGFGSSTAARDDDKDIVDIAVGSKDHTILVKAVKEAGLVETLKGKGPFTVFAPTDEAFKKLGKDTLDAVVKDKEKLKKVLLAHVVVDKAVTAADAAKLDGKKVNGFEVKAADGKVMIGGAKVTKADLKAKNGVIHVIDTVLVPAK